VTPGAAVRPWSTPSSLVGVYTGLVFLLGRLLDPATGDSALAVAALFQPASASLWLRRR
jgi:hypothetical protein